MVTNRLPVNCTPYESQSLCALDTIRWQCFHCTFTLTDHCIILHGHIKETDCVTNVMYHCG